MLAAHFQGRARAASSVRQLVSYMLHVHAHVHAHAHAHVARERLAQHALPRVEGLGLSEQRADSIDLKGVRRYQTLS